MKVSIEQWRSFVAVVEADGYAPAAERLHKSQSSVSYHVQKIERLLDVRLFVVQGRKAVLTDTGKVLYQRARTLLDEALRLEQATTALSAGWEPRVGLAVDVLYPTWLLLDRLTTFTRQCPTSHIEVIESVLDGAAEALVSGQAQLAICAQVPAGFYGDPLLPMHIQAVAAPRHALFQLGRPLSHNDLKPHRHIQIRETSAARASQVSWAGAEQRLVVSTKATAIRALCMGMGFSWLPQAWIETELAAGELKPLPLQHGGAGQAMLYLVHAGLDQAGPAVRLLAELLGRQPFDGN